MSLSLMSPGHRWIDDGRFVWFFNGCTGHVSKAFIHDHQQTLPSFDDHQAQAIEARQRQDAKTGLARKGESAVPTGCALN